MNFIDIQSYLDLQKQLGETDKSYLLLYKKDSEKSECALANIAKHAVNYKDITYFVADVSTVRDIHENYAIKSVPTFIEFEKQVAKNIVKGCQSDSYYKSMFEEALYRAKSDNGGTPAKQVTVYSTPTCSWCTTIKNYLRKNNIRFTDIDVSRDQKAAEAMVKKSGQQGVPQTDINGQVVIGFDQKKIDQLLGIS